MSKLLLVFSILLVILGLACPSAQSQTVPFPTGNRDFNAVSPWGYTNTGTNWDTSPFLPFIYQDMWFRIIPPNGVTYNSTTKTWNYPANTTYPMMLYFHGGGSERGTDNNSQLRNSGLTARDGVLQGKFPGFILFPQNVAADKAKILLEKLLVTLPIDVNRIGVYGISNGGTWSWDFFVKFPTLVAGLFPMSACSDFAKDPKYLFNPIRLAQGSLDINPAPNWTQTLVDYYKLNGGSLEYFYLEGVGHSTWPSMYSRPDFFSWFLAQKKNKITVLYNKNEICPGDAISVTMGFTPGFDAYEWRKDGVLIAGADLNKITVSQFGTYTGRLKNRGVWTSWSDPVIVQTKAVTNTPPIQVNGLRSNYLPAPDGSTTNQLVLPDGYETYTWKNAQTNAVLGTSKTYTAVIGTYKAIVKEVNGCSSNDSPIFTVFSANGSNKPDAIGGLIAYATSQTQVSLSWSDNQTPQFNETGFEVYRSLSSSSGYTLIAITGADVVSYNDSNLTANTTYYYKVRPIGAISAGPVSDVFNVLTQVDSQSPSSPQELRIVSTLANSVNLIWNGSTDNVGVYRYDIYKNGVKTLAVSGTTATIYNLTENQVYNFTVKARDFSGNSSAESNQVTTAALAAGLSYKYFEGTYTVLPNFNALIPKKTGNSTNIDLGVRDKDTYFALYWEGKINIPVAGNYTFGTTSDNGSKVYIGTYNEANLVVNNDGNHSSQSREGTKNFATPGLYPIVVTYFQSTNSFSMNLYWKNTAHGVVAQQTIPNSAFIPPFQFPEVPPAAPTQLTATAVSFNNINLTWSDNSTNETGFQLYRATANGGPYGVVATIPANTTTFSDQNLAAFTQYYYRIKAIGQYGESPLSSELLHGLSYQYYQQSLTSLSTFDFINSVSSGSASNFDLTPRARDTDFGFRWDGKIRIPTTGNYIFYTSSDDGSNLFIDGNLVVNNDFNQGITERSGTVNGLTAGIHTIRVNYRQGAGGFGLQVRYAGPGIAKQLIPATAMGDIEVNAKTLALPPAPLAPTNLIATSNSSTSINLSWSDNSTDETSFQILRATNTPANFVVYKTLAANANSFADAGLFANSTYYYKIVAINAGGSTPSVQAFATTKNTRPVISKLNDAIVKTNVVTSISILSSDADQEPLTLSAIGLPSFASLVDQTDGSGTLTFQPTLSNIGVYNLAIVARDQHNGTDTTKFKITVTDKNPPQILPVQDVSITEGSVGGTILSANSDFGASKLVWQFTGLPDFAQFSFSSGVGNLSISPNYTQSGTYPVVVTVTDSLQSKATTSFAINVVDKDPNYSISLNVMNSTAAAAPWNNITTGATTSLKDQTGASTKIGLDFLTPWWSTWYEGAVTGNNSGVYPDNVINDYYYFGIFGGPNTVDVKVKGLDPQRQYDFNFLGSSKWNGTPDNGSTVYSIGADSSILNVQNNSQNLAAINGITPAADSTIVFTMSKGVGSPAGYLNGLVITSLFENGSLPAAPRSLTAKLVGQNANINWVDAPFNENGFDIYRAESVQGPFIKINVAVVPSNSSAYVDATISESKKYFYKAIAFNSFGQSPDSNIDSVAVPNLAPRITVSGSQAWSINQTSTLSITATDPPINIVSLSVTGLPSFATYQAINGSSGSVVANPVLANIGSFSFTVSATDGNGATSTQQVSVTVRENLLYRVLVNFSQNSNALSPWNNTSKVPAINDVFSNLLDENGVNRGVSISLLSSFGGVYSQGSQTGNNSGMAPDAVLKEYYWFGAYNSPITQQIKVSGLDKNNKYSFRFISSTDFTGLGDNGSTVFTIGGKSSSVNVQGNTSNLAAIENIVTNSNGEVTVDISKSATAAAGYINGLIIEAIEVDASVLLPSNLKASGKGKTQIQLNWNDNSSTETAFEIHRSSTGANGIYQLLASTGSDINSYIDNAVTSGQIYYYKVRAILPTGPTVYTNIASSGTIAFTVYVNVSGNSTYDAPIPWNNFSRVGVDGDIFFGLRNDAGLQTGIRLRWEKAMEGENDWGMTTGNNSGVYPDKVLQSFYWTNAYNQPSRLVVDGLDQSFNYNFSFLGSINTNVNVTTNFTIGTSTVSNRQDLNTTTPSTIRDVIPDQNSEVLISIQEAAGSPWAIFNSLVIDAYPSDRKIQNNQGGRLASGRVVSGNLKEVRYGEANPEVTLYPNPANDATGLTVKTQNSAIGEVEFTVLDVVGVERTRGIYNIDTIEADFKIELNELALQSGMYLIRLRYPNGHTIVRKFIKN